MPANLEAYLPYFDYLTALDEAAATRLLARAELVELPSHLRLIRVGEQCSAVYILVSGRLLVRDAEERVLCELAAGAIVGEMAALGAGIRTASVDTADECRLIRFSSEEVTRALGSSLPIRALLHRIASERGAQAETGKTAPPSEAAEESLRFRCYAAATR